MGVYFADGADYSPQSMCNIYGYNLESCTEGHYCTTSNDTNFYCSPGNPEKNEPATIQPTGSFLCNQDEKKDIKGYIVNLVSTSEGTIYNCSNTPAPTPTKKWRCINGTCSLDMNCEKETTTCFDESTCGGSENAPNGICDCQKDDQDVMPKDRTIDNVCNWKQNPGEMPADRYVCVPRDASISKGAGGCITKCSGIPQSGFGKCKYDLVDRNVHVNECGQANNYNDCNKYMFAQYVDGLSSDTYCKCRPYTPSVGDFQYMDQNKLISFPIGNPPVLEEAAKISYQTMWKDTDCGIYHTTDSYGKKYNLFSCVRDCLPGKKCNFLADSFSLGSHGPTIDNTEWFLTRTGSCARDCPDDSVLDAPAQGCSNNTPQPWGSPCLWNAIHKNHVA